MGRIITIISLLLFIIFLILYAIYVEDLIRMDRVIVILEDMTPRNFQYLLPELYVS